MNLDEYLLNEHVEAISSERVKCWCDGEEIAIRPCDEHGRVIQDAGELPVLEHREDWYAVCARKDVQSAMDMAGDRFHYFKAFRGGTSYWMIPVCASDGLVGFELVMVM